MLKNGDLSSDFGKLFWRKRVSESNLQKSEKLIKGGRPLPEALLPALLKWYGQKKRDLPWRHSRDPYGIWVSEIMLQQTRVETVIPYYERFLKALPDAAALAACPEDELLKLWEGLGYYSRVRNMQKAAIRLCSPEGFDGTFPDTYEDLLSLPGFGSYTAGAVASIAFGRRIPAVDGNVLRIVSRLRTDDREIDRDRVKKAVFAELRAYMEGVVEDYSPGDFNQALMDLGATVCLPNGLPVCEACPLAALCQAHGAGAETDYPVRAPKKARRTEDLTILRIRDGERILIDRRPKKGLLAGLWEFPNRPGRLSEKEAIRAVEDLGLDPLFIEALPPAKHIFTHVEWRMTAYEVRVAAFEGRLKADADAVLVTPEQLSAEYSMPSAFRAYRPEFK